MSLEDRIQTDYISAMKARDKSRSATLSFLRAQLKNVKIAEKQDALTDEMVMQVIQKQVKQRLDSIAQYREAGREDLASGEETEMEILKGYLPRQISEEEIGRVVDDVIEETGASSPADIGKVMRPVLERVKGSADGKTVNRIVKAKLGG